MRLAFALTLLVTTTATGQADPKPHLQLDNGVRVLLWPIPDQDRIGIEAFYRVGFIHEPDGMTQVAHLIEHLVCNAGTASWEPRAAMKKLNEIGMANAETLPDWTHYDYLVPKEHLELALRIEAERLTSLAIDSKEIEIEAPRCYREADFVEKNPRANMSKHAMMALTQAWLHGRDRVSVRSGMEEFDLDAVKTFHRRHYRPDNLTLILVGGFDREQALSLIDKHLGAIPAAAEQELHQPDWSEVAPRHAVEWDASVRGVCVACPPPESRLEQVVLTLWGQQLSTALRTDAKLSPAVRGINCSNSGWSVGELPFFAYVALLDDVEFDVAEKAIHGHLDQLIAAEPGTGATARMASTVRALARRIEVMNDGYVNMLVRNLESRAGSVDRARGMVLGQGAINWGLAVHLFGTESEALAKSIESLTPAQLQSILQRNLARERRIVSTLAPR